MIWGDIQGWFDFDDIYDQAVNKAKTGSIFVEIGCWKGRSTAYLAESIKKSKKNIILYAVDTFGGTPDNYQQNKHLIRMGESLYNTFIRNMIACNANVFPIKLPSIEASDMFKDKSIDFVFIDGDHSYIAIKKDIETWYSKLKIGGILAGHDYKMPEVEKAVNEFAEQHKLKVIGKKSSWLILL